MMTGIYERTLKEPGADGFAARVDVSMFFANGTEVAVAESVADGGGLVVMPSKSVEEELARAKEQLAGESDDAEALVTLQWLAALRTSRVVRVEKETVGLSAEQVHKLGLVVGDAVLLVGAGDYIEICGRQCWEDEVTGVVADLEELMIE